MAKYIDVENLLNQLQDRYEAASLLHESTSMPDLKKLLEQEADRLWEIIRTLKSQPSVEVQEVKHGEWIFTNRYGFFHTPIYQCSECKKEVGDNHIDTNKYCLHCGTEMDGGEEEKQNEKQTDL